MAFQKTGEPKKIKSTGKAAVSYRRGINAHTKTNNMGKAWQPINVPMKGRLK